MPDSDSTWIIEFASGDLSAPWGAIWALCRCAQLAVGEGFRYLQIQNGLRLGDGMARWSLVLLDALPEDAFLIDVEAQAWEGEPPVDGVVDALSLAGACEDLVRGGRGSGGASTRGAGDHD
ncbi:MAG TPA: hypothetical protein VMS86_11630 [Thermoanaerobaculia bacterium]|nr:hypothetical protein [Thermoanaerobaculia bacterium]